MDNPVSIFLHIFLFSIPLTLAPGPGNLLLIANCAKFGYKKTFATLIGIFSGSAIISFLIAIGLESFFIKYAWLHWFLKIVSSGYIFYLAVKLYTSKNNFDNVESIDKSVTFLQAALLQIVNPKVWILSITAIAIFSPLSGRVFYDALFFSMALNFSVLPTGSLWAIGGLFLSKILKDEKAWKIFNRSIGIALASCIIFVFL